MTSMREKALALYEAGFTVMPLGSPLIPQSDPKKPLVAWQALQKRDNTEREIELWWRKWPKANIGIVTGRRCIVVDADSPEAVAKVKEICPYTPMMVSTSEGKMHFYFLADFDVHNSTSKNKIDIRGIGGYVVGPGSVHESGAVYTLQGEDLNDCALQMPAITREALSAVKVAQGHNNVLVKLSEVKLSSDGSNENQGQRNDSAASLAGQMLSKNMSLQQITEILSRWNAGNSPPMDQKELLTTIASVSLTRLRSDPLARIAIEEPENTSCLISVDELLNDSEHTRLPETFWREGVLFRGARVMVAGAPKIGKSRFVMAMGVASSIGGPFLGETFTQCKTAWLQAEIHKPFVVQRIAEQTKGLSREEFAVFRKNFFLSGRLRLDLMNNQNMQFVIDSLETVAPDIIIIDPIINFSTAKENDNAEVHELLSRADYLGEYFGAAVILVHHLTKGAKTFESIRGASAFRGWYDTCFLLAGDEKRPTMQLETRNAKGVNPMLIEFSESDGKYKGVLTEPEREAGRKTTQMVRAEELLEYVKTVWADGRNVSAAECKEWVSKNYSISRSQSEAVMTQFYRLGVRKEGGGNIVAALNSINNDTD